MLMTEKRIIVGIIDQPIRMLTARQAAIRRTPEASSRVMKNRMEPAIWVSPPKRYPKNS